MILLVLRHQACGLSEVTAWLPWQSPFWMQCGENDSLSVKKKAKLLQMADTLTKFKRVEINAAPPPPPPRKKKSTEGGKMTHLIINNYQLKEVSWGFLLKVMKIIRPSISYKIILEQREERNQLNS